MFRDVTLRQTADRVQVHERCESVHSQKVSTAIMAARDTVKVVYSKPFALSTISFSHKTNASLRTITVRNQSQDTFRSAASLQPQTAHQHTCVQSYTLQITLVNSDRPSDFQSMPSEQTSR